MEDLAYGIVALNGPGEILKFVLLLDSISEDLDLTKNLCDELDSRILKEGDR